MDDNINLVITNISKEYATISDLEKLITISNNLINEKIEEETITYNERWNKILGEKPLRHNLEYSMRICEYTMIKKMETILEILKNLDRRVRCLEGGEAKDYNIGDKRMRED